MAAEIVLNSLALLLPSGCGLDQLPHLGQGFPWLIAPLLRDVGVKAALVRYPREGHGLREPKHIVDSIDRSIRWYEEHFPALR